VGAGLSGGRPISRLRTILFGVALAVVTIVLSVAGTPALLFGERGARMVVKLWSRIAIAALALTCGVRHRVEGRGNLPEGGGIVAANHHSMWETIVFFTLLEKPVVIFKQELLKVPFYAWWGLRAGSIPVDRDAGARAIRDLSSKAAKKIAEGCQVVVFPEGTRARMGERLPLHPGAAAIYRATGALCTPAVHDSGRFWLFPGGLFSLKTPGVIRLRVLSPIEGGLDRKLFQSRLEAALSARLAEAPDPSTPARGARAA
jgi:1-acyl-sn-glycerol-3-phosphate acyltransferase